MENNENIFNEMNESDVLLNNEDFIEVDEEILIEDESEQKVLFDAEDIIIADDEDMNLLFDAEEEIRKKELENRGLDPNEELSGLNKTTTEEKQKNVFDNGLEDGKFIPSHRCPMCMCSKKSINEMYVRKPFSRKKRVVGYVSICANCGFTSFYSNNVSELLKYFRGKIKY